MKLKTSPDDLDELADSDVIRDEKLGLVKDWQLLLSWEPLNDAGNLAGMFCSDLLHIFHSQSCQENRVIYIFKLKQKAWLEAKNEWA